MFAAYVRHLGEDSPEVAVLRLLGFFDRATEQQLLDVLRAKDAVVYEWSDEASPAARRSQPKRSEDSLAEVIKPLLDLSPHQWHRVLNRLRDLRLIDFTGRGTSQAVDAHPLLRESFAEQVRTKFPEVWQAGHRRLFEYLSGTVPYWPEGIEGLQPLYQAVVHGCLAGLHEQARADIYRDRILRGTDYSGFYSTRTLGAIGADLGAVACFFTAPWTTLAPPLAPGAKAWLLSLAAFRLRALGRLAESVEPMRVGLEMYVDSENWSAAAITTANLSELELRRGELSSAVAAGEQAVAHADLGEEEFVKMFNRTILAAALHQAGRFNESLRLFEEAESRQVRFQPEHPRLYSLQGFQYWDLLLSDAERSAWQRCLCNQVTTSTVACEDVAKRAFEALQIVTHFTLATALSYLTIARATFYKTDSALSNYISAFEYAVTAVDGLRASGQIGHIPYGLLTRAWLRSLSGDESGCRADLEEAWEIAERGPMPLFQADIQLYRARLFRDRAALTEARRLIEKHGYHRRDGELADAEEARRGGDDAVVEAQTGVGSTGYEFPTLRSSS